MSEIISNDDVETVVQSMRNFFAGPNTICPLMEEEWRIDLQEGVLTRADLNNFDIVLNMMWEKVKQVRGSLMLGLPSGSVVGYEYDTDTPSGFLIFEAQNGTLQQVLMENFFFHLMCSLASHFLHSLSPITLANHQSSCVTFRAIYLQHDLGTCRP